MIDMTVRPALGAVPGLGGSSVCPPAGGTAEFRGTGASTLPWGRAASRLRAGAAVLGMPHTYDPTIQNFDPTLGSHSPGRPF